MKRFFVTKNSLKRLQAFEYEENKKERRWSSILQQLRMGDSRYVTNETNMVIKTIEVLSKFSSCSLNII